MNVIVIYAGLQKQLGVSFLMYGLAPTPTGIARIKQFF
jgi:hypothetical protein